MSACLLLPYNFHMGGFHEAGHPDLLQVCEAGPDWVAVPSRKMDGGAGVMAQGKEFKGRQFTAEVILWAVRCALVPDVPDQLS